MRHPLASPLGRLAALAALAVPMACTTAGEPAQTAGKCRPDAAQALAGQAAPSDAEARDATGASVVRRLQPGGMMTMDFRAERVTLEIDPATDRTIRAFCG